MLVEFLTSGHACAAWVSSEDDGAAAVGVAGAAIGLNTTRSPTRPSCVQGVCVRVLAHHARADGVEHRLIVTTGPHDLLGQSLHA